MEERLEEDYFFGSLWYYDYKNTSDRFTKDVTGSISFLNNKITVVTNDNGVIDTEVFVIRTVTKEKKTDDLKYRTNKGDFIIKIKNNSIFDVSFYTTGFFINFFKSKNNEVASQEIPLPIQEPIKEWKRIKIKDVGTIDLSPKLEIQGGKYKELKLEIINELEKIWGFNYLDNKLILQPKGVNDINETSTNKYCRIIVETTINAPNDYQKLNEKIVISAIELQEFNNEIKKQVEQNFMNTPLKVVEWYPAKIIEINGMPCFQTNFTRRLKDNPLVFVNTYRFFNNDRIHSLTISYRISEKDYWSSTVENTLSSFRITNIK